MDSRATEIKFVSAHVTSCNMLLLLSLPVNCIFLPIRTLNCVQGMLTWGNFASGSREFGIFAGFILGCSR